MICIFLGSSRTVPQTSRLPKGHWMNWKNREKFFLNMAARLGFDPNVAENWKKVKSSDVVQLEVSTLLNIHHYSSLAICREDARSSRGMETACRRR